MKRRVITRWPRSASGVLRSGRLTHEIPAPKRERRNRSGVYLRKS